MITLVLTPCYHLKEVERRPNPRKKWPDNQTCDVCGKKRRVVEIREANWGAS